VRERESRSNQQVEPEKLSSQKPADHKTPRRGGKESDSLGLFHTPLEFLHCSSTCKPHFNMQLLSAVCRTTANLLLFIYGFMPPTKFAIAQSIWPLNIFCDGALKPF